METKQEREARLRRMADMGRAYIVRYRETGEGSPVPPSKPWIYAPKPAECGKCQADGTVNCASIFRRGMVGVASAAAGMRMTRRRMLLCPWMGFAPKVGSQQDF